jgi:hypothetical protein
MRLLFVLCCLPAFSQVYLPHITDPNGSFSTEVFLTNAANTSQPVTLAGYSSSGFFLGDFTVTVNAEGHKLINPGAEFGSAIAYIQVTSNTTDVMAFATYKADTVGAIPATVGAKSPAPLWHLLAGDWDQTWDGVAVVNVGNNATTVRVNQVNSSGTTFGFHNLGTLGAGDKALLVLPSYFLATADSHFEIESLQGENLVVTALRGNADSSILWENAALRNGAVDQGSELERTLGIWVFAFRIGSSSFTDTFALADTGTSNGAPFVFGFDEFGDIVVATYSDGIYILFSEGTIIDQWYVYEIDGSGESASGCYYQGSDGTITSDCYSADAGKVVVNTKRGSLEERPILPPGNPSPEIVALGRKLHEAWLQKTGR